MQALEDLLTHLDQEYSWRIKELSSMKNSVYPEETENSKIFIRASLVFLYAHWEGFIRKATGYYLDYINEQGHNYGEINYNLTALALKKKGLQLEQDSDNIDRYYEAVTFILNRSSYPVELPSSSVIKDSLSLNSDQFNNLLKTLGLNEKYYDLKEKKLDEILIKVRNDIAHGKRDHVSLKDFETIYNIVIDFLDHFKNQIFESASLAKYLG